MRSIEVTDGELAILEELWSRGRLTIRLITDAVYPSGTTAEYATVQKLLDRLEGKGCVRRFKLGRANEFEAIVHREELIGAGLKKLASRLCDGSLTPLLTHLTSEIELSDADREALQRLIDESRKG